MHLSYHTFHIQISHQQVGQIHFIPMKLSLLQSFIFTIFILQASWCTANESSNAEKATIRDIEGLNKLSECEKYPALQSIRRIKCSNLVQDSNSQNRRFKRVDSMEIMSFSHEGGHGGGGAGGGVGGAGAGGAGADGTSGAGGSESNHQTHKKNNAVSSLSHLSIHFLEIGVCALISLSFLIF